MKELKFFEAINYNKYEEKISKDLFDFFISIDPTPTKEYSQWIILYFFKGPLGEEVNKGIELALTEGSPKDPHSKDEDSYEQPLSLAILERLTHYYLKNVTLEEFLLREHKTLMSNLKDYDRLKKKNLLDNPDEKNIMNIKGYNALNILIQSYSDKIEQIETEDIIKSKEVEKWYEDNEWFVVIPLSERASCTYGSHTKWCTNGGTDNNGESYFSHYTKRDDIPNLNNKIEVDPKTDLIIIGNKKDPDKKWQIHLRTNQFKDSKDDEVESRWNTLASFPKALVNVLYEKTQDFMFYPDKQELLRQVAKDASKKKDILQIAYEEVDNILSFVENNEKSLPFSDDTITEGITRYLSEKNTDLDINAVPWEYLSEEPEFADTVPEEERDNWGRWKHDYDLWSDEQRDRAYDKAIEFVGYEIDQQANDIARGFYNENWSYLIRTYSIELIIESIQFMIDILKYDNSNTTQMETVTFLNFILEMNENDYILPSLIIKELKKSI